METMMQNKIESENVCITDADPHMDVRTLWKRTFILPILLTALDCFLVVCIININIYIKFCILDDSV